MATRAGQLRLTSRKAFQGLAKKRRDVKNTPSYLKMEQSKLALQRRYRKLKEEGNTGAITATVCTATGGAAAGALGVYVPPIMGVPIPALVGVGLVLFGATGKASSKMHGGAACFGGGMLAKVVGDFSEEIAEKTRAPAAGAAVAP